MSTAAERVERLCDLGRLDDAERQARSALAAEPEDAALVVALARVLLAARRFAPGLEAADAAVALAPGDERAHRVRGLLLSGLGRHAEALRAGYTAVSIAPQEFYAALGYALVLQAAGRLADAREVALRAVALDPENPTGHRRLADIAAQHGDRATARRAYTEALRLDPDDAVARNDLAVLELVDRRPAAALRGFVEAGQLDPTLPEALRNVRVVLWQRAGRVRTALLLGTFGLLVAAGPGDDRAVLRVGAVLVLAVVGLLVVRSARALPPGGGPAVRAALRGDRLLAVTVMLLALGTGVVALVAATGWPGPAAVVWLVSLLLSVVAVVRLAVVRLARRRRSGRHA